MTYLLDTNIVSELSRKIPDAEVLAWARRINAHSISAITVEEIRYGISRIRNARLTEWIDAYLRRHPVLEVSAEIAALAGEMRGNFSRQGIVRSQADMLIAATAKTYSLTLATRNTKDFADCGIHLINPFISNNT